MLYSAELQSSDRLVGRADSPLLRLVVEPASGEPHEQRDGDDAHARVHEPRLGGRVAIPPYEDTDPGEHQPGEEKPRHSGRLRRSVKRRTPFLKSSVERASTLVTTPAAMPSSNERESSL